MGNVFEIVLIVVLTVLNGIFSMSETAIVSARRARLQQQYDEGNAGAGAALELAKQPDRFLSTVQIFITLIGILAGAFGGAGLSEDIAGQLRHWGVPEGSSKTLGFAIVVTCITYLSLVIGELVPKSLALNNPEGVAAKVAEPMTLLARFTSPLVAILSVSTRGLLKLMGVKEQGEQTVTEDEIRILIAQGTKAGAFAEEEKDIVERVFRTADRRVSTMMTPRREVVYLDLEDSWEENERKIRESPHSAFPVCEGSLDSVIGIVNLKRLWAAGCGGQEIDLRTVSSPPLFTLETTHALTMLEKFRGSEGEHVALVVDEYGNVVGLVTLHDVVEGIVGEIPSASPGQGPDPSAVQREDGSWLLDGMLPVEEMLRLLAVKVEPDDAEAYQTLGGFVMARLGHIPSIGERFVWANLQFEVLDMDGHRVDRVHVARVKESGN